MQNDFIMINFEDFSEIRAIVIIYIVNIYIYIGEIYYPLDMIILGDMNYDYVINESLHSNHIHYIESLYDMSQLITEKTRVTSNTESTLDLILTTNPSP